MDALLIGEPLSRVRAGRVSWLWEPYLGRGKLAVLDGDPGVGKSMLSIDLAARLSRGGELPGGAAADRPGVTVLLSAEDDAADTTRPRAEAAGADLDKLIFAADVGDRLPRLPDDLPGLEGLIRRHAADLLVIDPVMAFLPPEVLANTDQGVRRALTPLAAVAARTGCAVLLIRHLTKAPRARAVYRGSGSIGLIAAARTGLLAAYHPADPGLRILAVTKTNLAGPPRPLGFRIGADAAGRSVVAWAGPADVTAEDLCGPPEKALRPRDRVSDWLRRELAGGPRKAADVLAAAAAAGIPEATLRRAKEDLRVGSKQVWQEEGERAWYWFDPSAAWPADARFRRPFELPPLPDLDL